MKVAEELKKRMKEDPSFKEKFKNVKGKDEMIKIAKKEGYDLANCNKEIEQEIEEDMLESIAGGEVNKHTKKAEIGMNTEGDDNFTLNERSINI